MKKYFETNVIYRNFQVVAEVKLCFSSPSKIGEKRFRNVRNAPLIYIVPSLGNRTRINWSITDKLNPRRVQIK